MDRAVAAILNLTDELIRRVRFDAQLSTLYKRYLRAYDELKRSIDKDSISKLEAVKKFLNAGIEILSYIYDVKGYEDSRIAVAVDLAIKALYEVEDSINLIKSFLKL